MIPVQLNPASMMNLADAYRQQQAAAEAARQVEMPFAGGVSGGQATSGPFGQMLTQFVGEVNDKQAVSGEMVNGLLSGQDIPLHRVMIAMEEAGVAFQMMVEVRNKLLEGYQELMRMQV
jgi:flagellar hook-basal body complex protein FliE